MNWSKKQWGIEFVIPKNQPSVLSTLWNTRNQYRGHKGEPMRALLFTNRKDAREWCADKNAAFMHSSNSTWKVRPVRVLETVKRIK